MTGGRHHGRVCEDVALDVPGGQYHVPGAVCCRAAGQKSNTPDCSLLSLAAGAAADGSALAGPAAGFSGTFSTRGSGRCNRSTGIPACALTGEWGCRGRRSDPAIPESIALGGSSGCVAGRISALPGKKGHLIFPLSPGSKKVFGTCRRNGAEDSGHPVRGKKACPVPLHRHPYANASGHHTSGVPSAFGDR